jgi:hypothetical protein
MLYEESLWFKNTIQKHAQPGSLVLNIGSSTKEFIEVTQPYIKANLFDEFAKKTGQSRSGFLVEAARHVMHAR